jgi:hypothetical protein
MILIGAFKRAISTQIYEVVSDEYADFSAICHLFKVLSVGWLFDFMAAASRPI